MLCGLFGPTVITCQEPEVPTGGYVVGYDFNIHSSIEYHCDPGHKLIGTTTLQCNNNGEWSATPPECQCEFKQTIVLYKVCEWYTPNVIFIDNSNAFSLLRPVITVVGGQGSTLLADSQ